MRIESGTAFFFCRLARQSFQVGDTNLIAGRVKCDGARIPTDRYQPFENGFAFVCRIEAHDGDSILGTIGNIQCVTLGIERERVGSRAVEIRLLCIDPCGFDNFAGFGRQYRKRIAIGVSANDVFAIGRDGQVARTKSDERGFRFARL